MHLFVKVIKVASVLPFGIKSTHVWYRPVENWKSWIKVLYKRISICFISFQPILLYYVEKSEVISNFESCIRKVEVFKVGVQILRVSLTVRMVGSQTIILLLFILTTIFVEMNTDKCKLTKVNYFIDTYSSIHHIEKDYFQGKIRS